MTAKKLMRILSGIQPSGALHIGNYFGMMQPAVALQAEGEALYFIADYHALTSLRDPEVLRENSRRVALDFLACGLDPGRATLFRHSDVPQVTELAWILSTVAPMGLLERAHSYKDKLARGLAANVGLFSYPVLMAADILIYDSDVVPVGKDQKQHIEITRDLAVKMNETFGQCQSDGRIFKLPEARIKAATETVPGIDGQKMSKSYGNNIDIFGDEKEMRKRVMSIVTDSTPVEAAKDPTISTVFKLYSLVASKNEITAMPPSTAVMLLKVLPVTVMWETPSVPHASSITRPRCWVPLAVKVSPMFWKVLPVTVAWSTPLSARPWPSKVLPWTVTPSKPET